MLHVWVGQVVAQPQGEVQETARHPLLLSLLSSSFLTQTGAGGAHEEGGAGSEDGQSLSVLLTLQASVYFPKKVANRMPMPSSFLILLSYTPFPSLALPFSNSVLVPNLMGCILTFKKDMSS